MDGGPRFVGLEDNGLLVSVGNTRHVAVGRVSPLKAQTSPQASCTG